MISGLSICITTRNNLEYLRLCLKALEKYSSLNNEVLIHVDGSKDGTIQWLEENGYEFTQSEWRGLYSGWNTAAESATKPYMIAYSDDFIAGPDWDLNLVKWLREDRVIVPRLVEPTFGSYLPVYDCGRTPETFDEKKFVEYAKKIRERRLKPHAFGAPTLLTKRFRDIGGFDTRFDPLSIGDADLVLRLSEKYLSTKFYEARDVILYHFQYASKSKIPNKQKEEFGRRNAKRFEEKWGFGVGEVYTRIEARQ